MKKLTILSETAIQEIQLLTCKGKEAYLPTDVHLTCYPVSRKAVSQATGILSRGKFTFDYPAQAVIKMVVDGITDFKKAFQFFATPPDMAQYMVDQIVWQYGRNAVVLEPSAGQGALIDAFMDRFGELTKRIDMMELSVMNYAILQDKYQDIPATIVHGDFMERDTYATQYDVIIMNPPFTKGQDVEHITRAYELLAPGGQLFSYASASVLTNSQKKYKAFNQRALRGL